MNQPKLSFNKSVIAAAVALSIVGFYSSLNGLNAHKTPTTMAYAIDSLGNMADSTLVDSKGNYSFSNLPIGTYTFRIVHANTESVDIESVDHMAMNMQYHAALQWKSEPTADKEEVKLVGRDRTVSGKTLVASASRGSSKMEMAAPTTEIVTSRSYAMDAAVDRESASDDGAMVKMREPISGGNAGMKSGQMTAGNWSDLDNWDKWIETNKEETVNTYQKFWGFYPENRFSVEFLDSKGKPVMGEKVQLKNSSGAVVWNAITDNKGKAELFAHLNEAVKEKAIGYKVVLRKGEQVFEFKTKPYAGAAETFNLTSEFTPSPIVDIALVVDATGSMGDEIEYLKAEMLDVVTRTKQQNKCLDVRVGGVFYRDNGDEYLTRKSDFSSNPMDITNFIMDQSAGGGGDFPEAVDAAMEVGVQELSWSDKALSKIMFLILDAPPHEDAATKAKIQKYTQMAAAKGIKIIPITASGINQSTEFLMKYMAIATQGEYVYITDHSGIGSTHEKPTGVKENVQFLNDLMVDIIAKNTAWDGCSDSTPNTQNNPSTVELVTQGQWQAQFYPNPATDYIIVKSNIVPDKIVVRNIAGAVVAEITQTTEKTRIETANFSTGVYIVQLQKGTEYISCRMMVMR